MTVLLVLAGLFGGLFAYSKQVTRSAVADFPPAGRFISAEGVRLHYLDSAPEAPDTDRRQAIVLLHGASGNARDFAISIFDALARDFRVIAFDRPGHGYSERLPGNGAGNADGEWVNPARQARLIHGALTALGVRRPVITGHSWAGSVALAYALDYPLDTGAVVVLSGASHPWRSEPRFFNTWPAIPVWGDIFVNTLLAPGFQLSSEAAVARNFAPNPPPPEYARKAGLALLTRPDNWRANAEDMRELSGFLVAQKTRYGEIQTAATPVTIITGDADNSVSPANHAYKLHQLIAGSELLVMPGVGHMPHHARPAEVMAAIAALARRANANQGISGR